MRSTGFVPFQVRVIVQDPLRKPSGLQVKLTGAAQCVTGIYLCNNPGKTLLFFKYSGIFAKVITNFSNP